MQSRQLANRKRPHCYVLLSVTMTTVVHSGTRSPGLFWPSVNKAASFARFNQQYNRLLAHWTWCDKLSTTRNKTREWVESKRDSAARFLVAYLSSAWDATAWRVAWCATSVYGSRSAFSTELTVNIIQLENMPDLSQSILSTDLHINTTGWTWLCKQSRVHYVKRLSSCQVATINHGSNGSKQSHVTALADWR